jgi:hypothetical protein
MIEMIEIPLELAQFELPRAVHARLQQLLDQQDEGQELTSMVRQEAEGLVDVAEFLSLLRLRSQPRLRRTECATSLSWYVILSLKER